MVHLWRVKDKSADENEQPCEKNPLKLTDSVTAVTFASRFIDTDKFVNASRYCLCVKREFRYFVVSGLDNGAVFLYTWNEKASWQHLTSIAAP